MAKDVLNKVYQYIFKLEICIFTHRYYVYAYAYLYVLQVRMCVCICARILYPNKIRLTSVPCSFCWLFTVWDPHTYTHSHIFIRQILQSMAYCHCPVYFDFPFYLFSCFNCAHALHTYNCSSRASWLAPFHCVDIFLFGFVGLFSSFFDSNNHLSTSPALFHFAFGV